MTADRDVGVVVGVRPGDFRHRAACRGVDPELFFPTAESGPLWQAQVAAAKAVCAGCPVRPQCLAWALQALPDGIAGGMTPQERRREGQRAWAGRRGVQRVSEQPLTHSRRRRCRPIGGTRLELAAAGRAALAAGATRRQVAVEFRVTERTVQRWAQDLRTSACVAGVGRGAPAATGLPSEPPTTQTPWQGHEQRKDNRS